VTKTAPMQPFDDSTRPGLWKKLFLGAFLVIFAAASATAVAAFREIDKVVDALDQHKDLALGQELAESDPGKPQTILLLGSDRRPDDATDGGAGTGARSDTIILVRLDPERSATAMMSLPRDLRVEIPGHGVDKINAAYSLGGPRLTLRTVKRLTGLPINHVINVDFQGFRRAIDSLGCIYSDVDRRYYNDTAEYAFIDVPAGYQQMCGEKALQYARFRHEDSDLVRGIRQQDLLRDAKQQVSALALFDDRDELIEIFGKYTTSDGALKDRAELLRLIKLGLFSVGQPIRHVKFEGDDVGITSGDVDAGVPSYVTASDATVKKLAQQFLGVEDTPGPRGTLKRKRRGKVERVVQNPGGLAKDETYGLEQAVSAIERGLGGRKFPVYYPTVRVADSQYVGTRVYPLKTPDGPFRRSYRMVLKRPYVGEFYGIQGTRWRNPPILENPTETRKIGKRQFELHWEGDRLRLVAWRTPRASYWVSNTLLQTLGEKQMMAIARSTRLP